MLQDNQQTTVPVEKSQKTNWILLIAFSALFLILEFFGGSENIYLWLRGLGAGNSWNQFLISIISVIRPLAVVGAFVFISKQNKAPAILCATVNVVISLLMTIGIMLSPGSQLPIFALIAYCMDLLASLLFLMFSLGKTQKYSRILLAAILVFGVLSVLISFLLSMFVYPDGSFVGAAFWEQGGMQKVFFSNRETLARMMGSATIFWPIGQYFYFFAPFAGMRNGCRYSTKAPKFRTVAIVSLCVVCVYLLSVLFKGNICDVPGCNNRSSHKGQYGGHVYVCDEHADVRYYIDEEDGSVNFYKGSD